MNTNTLLKGLSFGDTVTVELLNGAEFLATITALGTDGYGAHLTVKAFNGPTVVSDYVAMHRGTLRTTLGGHYIFPHTS